MTLRMIKELVESELAENIIGAAIEVHRHVGPGLLESAYQACLARELEMCGLPFEREISLPVEYKGVHIDCGHRLDFIVGESVIVELKSMDTLYRY